MKLELIRKQMRKKALKLIPLVILLVAVFIGAYSYSTSNAQKLVDVTNQTNSIIANINQKQQEYQDTVKELDEYKTIAANKLPSESGYAVGRERLKALFPIIQTLKDKYALSKVNFSLTEIKQGTAEGITKFDLYENNIVIDLNGATDELVFAFINDLKDQIPGYVNILSIKLTRISDIDKTSISNYISLGTPLVSAHIELKWSALGMQKTAAPVAPGGGPGG